MAADVGGEPKSIETDRNQFEPGAARHQMEEFTAIARKRHRQRRRMPRHDIHLIH
jgi:hypothetical protein